MKYQVCPSTADLFRPTPETDANGVSPNVQFRMHQSSGSANDRFAASCRTLVHYLGIGLEIAPSLGYCTGMQDGDDEWLSCFGVPGALAGIADPGLSASVLIGGCVAFWRIGLVRLSSMGIGCAAWGMLPALISAVPAAVFHRLGSLVFLQINQYRAEGAHEFPSILAGHQSVAFHPLAKALESKDQQASGHAGRLQRVDQLSSNGKGICVGHHFFYRGALPVRASQGSFWWICAGRFVLLVPPAPLVPAEAAASPWRQAPRGCLVPLTAAVRLWRRSSGCLRMGRPGPLKALVVSPWRRAPPRCLLQGLRGPRKVAVRSWWRAPLGCGLSGRRVPLKLLASPSWQKPQGCLAPDRLGALLAAVAAS